MVIVIVVMDIVIVVIDIVIVVMDIVIAVIILTLSVDELMSVQMDGSARWLVGRKDGMKENLELKGGMKDITYLCVLIASRTLNKPGENELVSQYV